MLTLPGKAYRKVLYELTCLVVQSLTDNHVLSGPFKGMKYSRSRLVSYCPKALGTYELELAPLIEYICAKSFSAIINVGAAEGYYAVGLALRNPQSQAIAFEAQEEIARLLIRLADANDVRGRIQVHGLCDVASLSAVLSDHPNCVLVMDVEGAEIDLLNPETVSALQHAYILVELHDCLFPHVSSLIARRFLTTHKIVEVWTRSRTTSDFPRTSLLKSRFPIPECLIDMSMAEGRPSAMRWLYLEPFTRI